MASLQRFDQVQIKTTKNVIWMSADNIKTLSPKGLWSVVNVAENNHVIICKDTSLVCIPIVDVVKVAEYNLNQVFNCLEQLHVKSGEKIGNTTTGPEKT